MCGIFASLALTPENKIEISALTKALDSLNHRGPDGSRYWLSETKEVALGQTRLAIIGLSDLPQPIFNENKSIAIVVNGEFYDYENIRDNLLKKGHKFNTNCDSEIALHLYEEYGTECLKYLRGEFSFVLWDSNKKRLFAARDRFGIKPFVYTIFEQKLVIASEAKALFVFGVPAKWDLESLFYASSIQYVLPNKTLFHGINQLEPGNFLLYENNNLSIHSYWDLDFNTIEEEKILFENFSLDKTKEKEYIDSFGSLLKGSIKLRLRSDLPVCFHLSGGLDSASIVGEAASLSSKPINCFSVSFFEETYDEIKIAENMAKYSNAELEIIRVSQKDILENLENAVYFSEGIAINGHLSAKYLLHKKISEKGFRVTLSGEGSDELLAGYPHLREDLFEEQNRPDLIQSIRNNNKVSRGIMLKQGNSLSLESVDKYLGFIPSFLQAKGSMGYKINSVLSPDFKTKFKDLDCYISMISYFRNKNQLQFRQRLYQSTYIWTKTALANYILKTLGDGTEMAHSVEGRVPFLDHHLFEFVKNIPLSMKIKNTVEKYILREWSRNRITEEIYLRQKHPFMAPPLSGFINSEIKDMIKQQILSQEFTELPFFSNKKILFLLDNLDNLSPEEAAASDPVFMTALSVLALSKRFSLSY